MGEHTLPASHPAAASICRGRFLLPVIAVVPLLLSGCAGLIQVASHPVMTGVGLMSVAVTGKGLADHALDMVTRQDCRLLEGLLRERRALCEQPGSLATRDDFRGIGGWMPDRDSRMGSPQNMVLALDTRLDSNGPPSLPTLRGQGGAGAEIRLALRVTPLVGPLQEPGVGPMRRPAGAPVAEGMASLQ